MKTVIMFLFLFALISCKKTNEPLYGDGNLCCFGLSNKLTADINKGTTTTRFLAFDPQFHRDNNNIKLSGVGDHGTITIDIKNISDTGTYSFGKTGFDKEVKMRCVYFSNNYYNDTFLLSGRLRIDSLLVTFLGNKIVGSFNCTARNGIDFISISNGYFSGTF